jgi:hypothetical protein
MKAWLTGQDEWIKSYRYLRWEREAIRPHKLHRLFQTLSCTEWLEWLAIQHSRQKRGRKWNSWWPWQTSKSTCSTVNSCRYTSWSGDHFRPSEPLIRWTLLCDGQSVNELGRKSLGRKNRFEWADQNRRHEQFNKGKRRLRSGFSCHRRSEDDSTMNPKKRQGVDNRSSSCKEREREVANRAENKLSQSPVHLSVTLNWSPIASRVCCYKSITSFVRITLEIAVVSDGLLWPWFDQTKTSMHAFRSVKRFKLPI